MLASPSIQKIASALARTPSPRPTVKTASRILCLRLEAQPSAGFKRLGPAMTSAMTTAMTSTAATNPAPMQAIVEAFLKYSPRVHWRPLNVSKNSSARLSAKIPQHNSAGWVFIDIASTSHLYHGEEGLMRSAQSLARDLGFCVQCAVADTPAGAQAFATSHHETIIPPGEERERLKDLSLPHLLHLEGLEPWAKPSAIESIITFFMMLGFKTADDLSRFTLASLHERWGETGALLWKKINAQDRQVVSTLLPTEPLEDYVHLDFPVSLVSLLLHQTQKSVEFLFARLQGRRSVARKLVLVLHCEYSKTQHKIEIEPNTPSRDRDLFLTLLENRLSDIDLENPIRDFEMHVIPVAEKTAQMDFFEPRNTDRDKLQTLFSLLNQSSLKPGLYRIEPAILPENGWCLASSPEERSSEQADDDEEVNSETETQEQAIAPQPEYGAAVMTAPRPTRILAEPMPLALEELQRLKILSSSPIERLENGWWEPHESHRHARRDYYFAISSEGQCLWIFQNLRTEEYFLHGYFD